MEDKILSSHKLSKPFLTFEQQTDKLSEEKKLKITDKVEAQDILSRICYYALIDGYKNLFYNPMTRQYKEGTRLEDILSLYYYDEELRSLYFKYLCHIEQRMRSLISYYFSEKYSNMQTAYLNPENYNYAPKFRNQIDYMIDKVLAYEANVDSKHEYVVYHRNTYGNVPLWVLLNTLTYGQISKMYTYLKTGIQSRISRHFEQVSEKELGQFLRALTNFRNICAHNERLFSFRSNTDIPDKRLHKSLSIPQKGNSYKMGKNDLFSVTIAFRYLLPRKEFLEFKSQLIRLIERTLKNSHVLTEETLLNAMGFPQNWKEITRYKL